MSSSLGHLGCCTKRAVCSHWGQSDQILPLVGQAVPHVNKIGRNCAWEIIVEYHYQNYKQFYILLKTSSKKNKKKTRINLFSNLSTHPLAEARCVKNSWDSCLVQRYLSAQWQIWAWGTWRIHDFTILKYRNMDSRQYSRQNDWWFKNR